MLAIKNELAVYCGKRKHVSQFAESEVEGLWKRLYSIRMKEWRLTKHALDRLKDKGIRATKKDVVTTLLWADIVEYKIDYDKRTRTYDERVVVRSKSVVNEKYNMHVVYSLTNKSIITLWVNHIEDFHSTLDWNIYDKHMKVFI